MLCVALGFRLPSRLSHPPSSRVICCYSLDLFRLHYSSHPVSTHQVAVPLHTDSDVCSRLLVLHLSSSRRPVALIILILIIMSPVRISLDILIASRRIPTACITNIYISSSALLTAYVPFPPCPESEAALRLLHGDDLPTHTSCTVKSWREDLLDFPTLDRRQ